MRRGLIVIVTGTVSLAIVGVALSLAAGQPLAEFARSFNAGSLTGALVFAVVGAVITARRPDHPIGPLFLSLGAIQGLSLASAGYALRPHTGGPLPGAGIAGWLLNWVWVPVYALLADALLRFPDGALPSARWRPLRWVVIAATAITCVTHLLMPTPFLDGTTFHNPVAWPGSAAALVTVDELALSVTVFALLPAAASLLVRLRRARGRQRDQLRLFCLCSAAALVAYVALGSAGLGWLGFTLAWPTVAIAAGVGIVRHRLFDIDRFISRTVTYGIVTTLLAGIYLMVAVVPSTVLDLDSDLLVAAATLAAAAVFVPVRRRVRAVVDRRFNRARYDAAQVVDRFGARLRQSLDLDRLAADLRAVVSTTVQPTTVSVWLRSEGVR